jgi:hypothetical protein
MTTDNNLHQTYLKDCNCSDDGIIIKDGAAVCRWCRTPYAKGGCMAYEEKHFQQKPKEWEILSVIDGVKNGIDETGLVAAVNPSDTYSWMKSGVKIHSVRRLSDGEVFTVGDRVRLSGTATAPIISFEIRHGEMWARGDLTKAKQPLFTTEDGKEVYVGDEYWFLSHSNAANGFEIYHHDFATHKGDHGDRWKYFSTEEAAANWVLWNKPTLSLANVMAASESEFGDGRRQFDSEHLKQLAKSKLNQP